MPDEEEKKEIVSEEDDRARFWRVVGEAVAVFEEQAIPYFAGGSIALSAFGHPEESSDADLVVKPGDADRALEVLGARGFETEKAKDWLYKARKDRVLVDLIFKLGDVMEMDDEMHRRAGRFEESGVTLAVIPPEDFIVSQALSAKKEAPDYWFNGVVVAKKGELDWDYLLQRAGFGPLRVLSLLILARAEGAEIPEAVLEQLAQLPANKVA